MTKTISIPNNITELLLSYNQESTLAENIFSILNTYILKRVKDINIAREKAKIKQKIIQKSISTFVMYSMIQIFVSFFLIFIGIPPVFTDFFIFKSVFYFTISTSYCFFKKQIFPDKTNFKIDFFLSLLFSFFPYLSISIS